MNQEHPKGAQYLCDDIYYKRSAINLVFMFINDGWTRSRKTWDEIIENKEAMQIRGK